MNKRAILILLVFFILLLGWRAFYYGSVFRSCIYTEKEIELSETIKNSKFHFIKPAVVVTEGLDKTFLCLPEIGLVTNEIVEMQYASHYTQGRKTTVTPEMNLVLEPYKMMAVMKHGITTIDSGSGPINYLILKDSNGLLYQVGTVGLGLNKGDEFLKAVSGDKEFILSPDIKFEK